MDTTYFSTGAATPATGVAPQTVAVRMIARTPARIRETMFPSLHPLRVTVNGVSMTRPWGESVVHVYPGAQVIEVCYLWFGRPMSRRTIALHVSPGAVAALEYQAGGWPKSAGLKAFASGGGTHVWDGRSWALLATGDRKPSPPQTALRVGLSICGMVFVALLGAAIGKEAVRAAERGIGGGGTTTHFAEPAGHFTADFPGTPVQTRVGPATEWHAYDGDHQLYSVEYVQLATGHPDAALASAPDTMAGLMSGSVQSRQTSTCDGGDRCLDYVVSLNGGGVMNVHDELVGEMLFQVSELNVDGAPGGWDAFMRSVHFTR